MKSKLFNTILCCGLLSYSTVFLSFSVCMEITKDDFGNVDFRYLYVAGRAWLAGENPYDYRAFLKEGEVSLPQRQGMANISCPFAYAPTISALVIPLAGFSYDTSRYVFVTLNLTALAILATFFFREALSSHSRFVTVGNTPVVAWFVLLMTLASPTAAFNYQMGQTSLLLVMLLSVSILSKSSGYSFYWILLTVSSIKPSLSILFLIDLLFARKLAVYILCFVSIVLFSVVPLSQLGPIHLFETWISSMMAYTTAPQNTFAFDHVTGLTKVLHSRGASTWPSVFLGFALYGRLLTRRSRLSELEWLGLRLTIPILFFRSHIYDFIALLPLLAALLITNSNSVFRFCLSCAIVLFLTLPTRLFGPIVTWQEIWVLRQLLLLIIILRYAVIIEWRIPYQYSTSKLARH